MPCWLCPTAVRPARQDRTLDEFFPLTPGFSKSSPAGSFPHRGLPSPSDAPSLLPPRKEGVSVLAECQDVLGWEYSHCWPKSWGGRPNAPVGKQLLRQCLPQHAYSRGKSGRTPPCEAQWHFQDTQQSLVWPPLRDEINTIF